MAKFSDLSQPLQEDILAEFTPVALQAATAVPGGVDRAKVILAKWRRIGLASRAG
jgi:hypothetical protein